MAPNSDEDDDLLEFYVSIHFNRINYLSINSFIFQAREETSTTR